MKASIGQTLVASMLTLPALLIGFSSAHAAPSNLDGPLQISINKSAVQAKTGDNFTFETTVVNKGSQQAKSIVVAMNIVNLKAGDPVDPEDWSPQRTQTVESLNAQKSATQTWKVNAILKGNYLIYLVAVAKPSSSEKTVQPVASQAVHISVREVPRLNPGGVLPVALGVPAVLGTGLVVLHIFRRRNRG